MANKIEAMSGNKRPAIVKHRVSYAIKKHHALYIMLIPAMLYIAIFKLIPLLSSVIAFMDYNIYTGFFDSEWVGLKWFIQFFSYDQFRRLLGNTVVISSYQLIFAFPAPIILACLLNEVRRLTLKRSLQTIVYLPHFLSWSIVYGISYSLLSTRVGLVNLMIMKLGFEPIHFLSSTTTFRPLIIIAGIWKEMGWGTIIFLAAITSISVELYEAATIDGAGRWKQFVHVTFPGLLPAITTMLLLKMGFILDAGFEQIFTFLTPMTYSVGDVLDTFAFIHGIQQGQFGISTAVGLFKSLIGLVLMLVANKVSKLISGNSLF